MEYLPHVSILAAALAVGAAVYSLRSWPIGVRAVVRNVTERVQACEANVEAAAAKQRAALVEVAEFMEAAEGVLEAVETKRRRIAARQSAEARKNGSQEDTSPEGRRLSLLRLAREQGHTV